MQLLFLIAAVIEHSVVNVVRAGGPAKMIVEPLQIDIGCGVTTSSSILVPGATLSRDRILLL
jgi:hypothetical protein